jgi:hypothetical protein
MPDAHDKNVFRLRKNDIAHNIARCAEAEHDLAYVGILGRLPNAGNSCNRSIAVQISANARRAASGLF